MTREDFTKRGISPERIGEFWKSDKGKKLSADNLVRTWNYQRLEALKALDSWIGNQ